MRTREQIENAYLASLGDEDKQNSIALEVLLDIRELLMERNKRGKKLIEVQLSEKEQKLLEGIN